MDMDGWKDGVLLFKTSAGFSWQSNIAIYASGDPRTMVGSQQSTGFILLLIHKAGPVVPDLGLPLVVPDSMTDKECLVLSKEFQLPDSSQVVLRDAHVNFNNTEQAGKHGLVNGLPSKLFTNEHNCVACNKGKQHKASYKAITAVSTISEPLQLLHMDLFGPTSIRSIDHKHYSLVVTDDFSRFSWVFFLGTKDETLYP
ncbi:putative ribonuclease H-like domain-containing protein [Tanacetum coccineum]